MTASPLPLATPVSEWTSYSITQLAVTFLAIVVSSVIALLVSRKAYENALRAQAAATRLAREQLAHDYLTSLLLRHIDWLGQARGLLFFVSGQWRVSAHLGKPVDPDGATRKVSESDVGELKALAEGLSSAGSGAFDAALAIPPVGRMVNWIESLGWSEYYFWQLTQDRIERVYVIGHASQSDVHLAHESMTYLRLVQEFCIELRTLIQGYLLRQEYDAEKPPPGRAVLPDVGKWIAASGDDWNVVEAPPHLPGVFVEPEAKRLREQHEAELAKHSLLG